MSSKRTSLVSMVALTTALTLASASAYAQAAGTTAPLTGVISDTGGRIASSTHVVVRNNVNGSQWPGGRMTQFGLRFSW